MLGQHGPIRSMTVIVWVAAVAAILFFAARFVPHGTSRRGLADGRPVPTSARWLSAECSRLASANASWTEVLASVNPEQDVEIDTLLARIRASYVPEPRAGLMAIEDGCRLAIEQNDMASAFDGLTVTVRNLRALPVVRW